MKSTSYKNFTNNSSGGIDTSSLVSLTTFNNEITTVNSQINTLNNNVYSIQNLINGLFYGSGSLPNLNAQNVTVNGGLVLVNSNDQGISMAIDNSGNLVVIGNITFQGNLKCLNLTGYDNTSTLQFNVFNTWDQGNNETIDFFTNSGNTINFSNTGSTNNFYGANNFNTINSNNIQELSDSAVVEIFTNGSNTNTLNIGHSALTTNINSTTTNINNLAVSENCTVDGTLNVNNMALASGYSLGTSALKYIMFFENNITGGSIAFQFSCSYSFYICLNCSDFTTNSYQKTEFNGNIHSGSPSYNTNNLGSFNSSEPVVTIPSSGQI